MPTTWPQAVDNEAVRYVVAWNPADGFFAQFPRLRALQRGEEPAGLVDRTWAY